MSLAIAVFYCPKSERATTSVRFTETPIFTVRKRSCGKVMFLHVSVCSQGAWLEACMAWGCVWLEEQTMHSPYSRQADGVLLECWLVIYFVFAFPFECSHYHSLEKIVNSGIKVGNVGRSGIVVFQFKFYFLVLLYIQVILIHNNYLED